MMLVKKSSLFDILAMQNMYDDIISDIYAVLIGGFGFTPSYNIIEKWLALAEARHDSTLDIAGKDLADLTTFLFSAITMF